MLAGPDPAPPASQRKRTRLRRIVYALAAPLLFALARGLWATCRVRVVEGEELLEATLHDHPTCVPTFWHEQLIGGAIFLVDTLRLRKRELAFLISPSIDGDLVTAIVERAGGRVVRGSATRSGVKSLRDLYRLMRKHSASPLFTPDGPVGPPRKSKLGAILLPSCRAPRCSRSPWCRAGRGAFRRGIDCRCRYRSRGSRWRSGLRYRSRRRRPRRSWNRSGSRWRPSWSGCGGESTPARDHPTIRASGPSPIGASWSRTLR